MLPRVIIFNGLSLDGRMDWGIDDQGLYYSLVDFWKPDGMLSGSNTILSAPWSEEIPAEFAEMLATKAQRQLLAIVDSRGRIHNWPAIRKQPFWRDAVALCSHSTPPGYLDELAAQQVETIVAGTGQVDLRRALEELNERFGVKVVRVDSGGILTGALLRAGLVDEVSLLISPCLVGGTTLSSLFRAPDLMSSEGVMQLRLSHFERLRDDIIWLRYEVVASPSVTPES